MKRVVIVLCCMGLLAASAAHATMVNMLSAGAKQEINDVWFYQADPQATGSGVIHSFVRINANYSPTQGYNTSYRPLEFDENNSGVFTHDLLLAFVPLVKLDDDTGWFYEFILDINETDSNSGGEDPRAS